MASEYNFDYLLSRCTLASCSDVAFCIERVEAGKRALTASTAEDGLVDWLCFAYLHDVWIGESPAELAGVGDSQGAAIVVWEGGERPANVPERSWQKLQVCGLCCFDAPFGCFIRWL